MDGLEAKLNKILSDPEALGSVLEMAKSLAGPEKRSERGEAEEERGTEPRRESEPGAGVLGELLGGMDPAMMGKIMGLVGEYTREDDRRTHFLKALKPYVRTERQGKMDRAAQIIKMARTARLAMGSFRGDENV